MFHPRNMSGRHIIRSLENSSQLVPSTIFHPSKWDMDMRCNFFPTILILTMVLLLPCCHCATLISSYVPCLSPTASILLSLLIPYGSIVSFLMLPTFSWWFLLLWVVWAVIGKILSCWFFFLRHVYLWFL